MVLLCDCVFVQVCVRVRACVCMCVLEGVITTIAFMEPGETAKEEEREDIECWPLSPPTWVLESLRSDRAVFCICWLGVWMKGEEGLDSGRERLLCPGDLRSPGLTVTDP